MHEVGRPAWPRPSGTATAALADELDGTIGVVVPVERLAEVEAWLGERDTERIPVLEAIDTKGLEFDGIVVVEPDEIVAESEAGIRTLYVVLTRATQQLDIVGTTNDGGLAPPDPRVECDRIERALTSSMTCTSAPAYALVRLQGDDHVTLLGGRPRTTSCSATCRSTRDARRGPAVDRLVVYAVRADPRARVRGARATTRRSSASRSTSEHRVPIDELLDQLPDEPIATVGEHGFDIDDEAYADIVGRIIDDEIGNGEGANLVIAPQLHRDDRRLGRRQGADRLPSAARARTRRLLDVRRLHRRPLPRSARARSGTSACRAARSG